MSTFSQEGLQGTKENFALTIKAVVDREWDTDNVDIMPKPVFITGEAEPDTVNPTEMLESITFAEGHKRNLLRETADDGSQYGMERDIIITIFAPIQNKRDLIEDELFRIFRKISPRNGSKIKKLDNANNSAILSFDDELPTFIPFGLGRNEQQKAAVSQGILKVRYQLNWTA